jgi:5-methylcytosine-specific restriction protein A
MRGAFADRAAFMRKRLQDHATRLPVQEIELGSNGRLAGDYEAGHALGITYIAGRLPTDGELRNDLQAAVRAYRALTFRGGLDTDVEQIDPTAPGDLLEGRRYRLHMRIERNPRAARLAKQYHGTRCQACLMDFAERYGPLGAGFIEAHHLRPISTLEEGMTVRFDVASDFAVLCSNCHRMIHRTDDPSDITGLRQLIRPTLQS